jgi:hypothetical protein
MINIENSTILFTIIHQSQSWEKNQRMRELSDPRILPLEIIYPDIKSPVVSLALPSCLSG